MIDKQSFSGVFARGFFGHLIHEARHIDDCAFVKSRTDDILLVACGVLFADSV